VWSKWTRLDQLLFPLARVDPPHPAARQLDRGNQLSQLTSASSGSGSGTGRCRQLTLSCGAKSSLEAGGGKLLWLAWTMYSIMLPTYDVFAAGQRCLMCTLKPALTSARRTLLMLCDVIYV